jgi:hypothetical protein
VATGFFAICGMLLIGTGPLAPDFHLEVCRKVLEILQRRKMISGLKRNVRKPSADLFLYQGCI